MTTQAIPRSMSVALATTAVMAVIAAAVFGLGDRSTLVPAPEAVAEGLLEQVATHRYRQTTQYVSDDARAALSPRSLRAWFEPIERRIGAVHNVDGLRAYAEGDSAQAIARLAGETESATCEVSLARRHGLWLVTDVRER